MFDASVSACNTTCGDTAFAVSPSDETPFDCTGHVNDLVWSPEHVVCTIPGCSGDECCTNVPLHVARLLFDRALAAEEPRCHWQKVSTTLPCLINM